MSFNDAIMRGLARLGGHQEAATPPATATPPAATTPPNFTPEPPQTGSFDPNAAGSQQNNSTTPPATATPPAATTPPATATPPAATTPPAFEAYELKPIANGILGEDEVKKFTKQYNDLKIPKAAAEAILKQKEELLNEALTAVKNMKSEEVKEWYADLMKDPEVTNELGVNQQIVKRYLVKQPQGFQDALSKSGLLNHKDVVKYFIAEGKKIVDDKSVNSGGQPQGSLGTLEADVKALYAGKM